MNTQDRNAVYKFRWQIDLSGLENTEIGKTKIFAKRKDVFDGRHFIPYFTFTDEYLKYEHEILSKNDMLGILHLPVHKIIQLLSGN